MSILPESENMPEPNLPTENPIVEASGDNILPEEPPLEKQPESEPPMVNVEDFTVAELIGQFFHAPIKTWIAFAKVALAPVQSGSSGAAILAFPALSPPKLASAIEPEPEIQLSESEKQRVALQLGFRLTAFMFALYGSAFFIRERSEEFGLFPGAPFLLIGFLVWIFSELYGSWPKLTAWLQSGKRLRSDNPQNLADNTLYKPLFVQAALGAAGFVTSYFAYTWNQNNRFTVEGVLAWWASIILWVLALAPSEWGPLAVLANIIGRIRGFRLPRSGTFWLLLAIMLVGAYFRLNNLSSVPPEMTSDHVEKLLDSQRILDGNPQVFFPNNGGRDPIQFYTMALFSRLPGLGMNFLTLKLLTVLEGLITIPVLWWMGREIIGKDEPVLGNIVGLVLAALVAVSYWHEMLSRLGLRIVLTPLFTALLLIYLSRALRYNRRADFIKAGLVLGFGLYAYQAIRMLPVVIVVGGVIAVIFAARTWRARQDYLANLIALVIVSFVVFVPLFGFSVQYPDYFWMRTSGRLLGDDLIQTTDSSGRLVRRKATFDERLAAFQKNLPVLMNNVRNALLMYNWKGDVAWINGSPNRPEMDIFIGSLLIVGLGAWLARMVRRRDIIDWLLPMMLFIMLLPSILSIAYPNENPSATRTSGTLPEAYLFAALPLALGIYALRQIMNRRQAAIVGVGAVVLVSGSAYAQNAYMYFTEYRQSYLVPSLPYSQVGQTLRDFADKNGYGNAFLLAYRYWWDHRALGLEGGFPGEWPNGIPDPDGDEGQRRPVDDLPRFMYQAYRRPKYPFDPEKDILIFYAPNDEDAQNKLLALFPTGYWELVQTYQPEDTYKLFHVPALGSQGFVDFVVRTNATSP
jgi:hypothetical protein